MEKVTNIIRIHSNAHLKMSPEGDFFRCWVAFLQAVHGLTEREMDVLAAFLKKRYELSKAIKDVDTLDHMLMSESIKKQVKDECGISMRHLRVILSTFRRKGVLRDNKFYMNLIPCITKDGVGLMVVFDFKDEQQRIKLGPPSSVQRAIS
jgi:hypothetical protein